MTAKHRKISSPMVRAAIAVFLITTATLKILAAINGNTEFQIGGFGVSAVTIGMIAVVELALGLALLTSYWQIACLLCLVLFTGFGIISTLEWLSFFPKGNCGCFGEMDVSPLARLLISIGGGLLSVSPFLEKRRDSDARVRPA